VGVISRLRRKTAQWVWLTLVVFLPVTSMPLVVKLVRSDAVASPSILLLAVLMLVWFVPFLWTRGVLPRQSLPILAFVLVALVSTVLVNFKFIPPYKDISILRSSITSFATLGIGLSFYLTASVFPLSEQSLRRTMCWLNWSGLVLFAWSLCSHWHGMYGGTILSGCALFIAGIRSELSSDSA